MPEFATVAGITVICFLIGMAVKASPLDDKFIPIIVGICGGCLGVTGLFTMADFPAANVIDAVAVGIASGLVDGGCKTGEIPVWKQPTGAQDAYMIGDKVHYPTKDDPVYENTLDYNIYAPDVYGWIQI